MSVVYSKNQLKMYHINENDNENILAEQIAKSDKDDHTLFRNIIHIQLCCMLNVENE